MVGFIFSIIAGAAMSIQGVFNTRLSDKIGLYESNAFVQGTAFVFALIVMFIMGKGNLMAVREVKWFYLTGGLIGILITITVMLGITHLKPTAAVSVILIAQLITAAMIDAFGVFGTEKTAFGWSSYLGIGLMIAGIIVFKSAN